MVTKVEWGAGDDMDWELGINRCKVLYMKWVSNKILLYSTGNCIQYCRITYIKKNLRKVYNGKNFRKVYIYIYGIYIHIYTHTYH